MLIKAKPARRSIASQSERFIAAARELGCDDDKEHFEKRLGAITRAKPSAPKKKPKAKAGG